MFLKLLKHELYAAGRSLLPVFAGLLLMAGLARGSVWMMERLDTKLSNILGWLIIGLFVLFCVAVVVSTPASRRDLTMYFPSSDSSLIPAVLIL